MDTNNHTPRMIESTLTNAEEGIVRWTPLKSVWYLSHLGIALVGGALFFSWAAFSIFVLTTSLTLCLGHSLGMHRRLIHNSYDCPRWLEYLFVHLGVLVGMAGPYGMIHQHDLRDWAQRKRKCHSYLRHGENFWRDGWWQLNCDLQLTRPPKFQPEERIEGDRIYGLMEKTWMLQQLPWIALLYFLGGLSWVIWGISVRIAVSTTGHWLIGYFAHNEGHRDWHIKDAAVQGHNVRFASWLTMGESWHNNHHAWPGSAMLGIYENQPDPGWWVLNRLMNIGLVWNVKLPKDLPYRPELTSTKENGPPKVPMREPRHCSFLQSIT